jgi:Spy/CpxP family protein refolding chaperone
MTLSLRLRLLAACVVLSSAVVSANTEQQRPPATWWKTEPIVKELGLTPDQSARIEQIFQSTLPELRQERDELEKLETKLSRMIQDDRNDEATLARQIDRVETARAGANKTRSLMLMRMRKVLTPDQRARLEEITKRRDRERNQGFGSGPRPGPPPGNRPPPDSKQHPQF